MRARSGGSSSSAERTTITSSTAGATRSTTCSIIGTPNQGSQAFARPMRDERPPHRITAARLTIPGASTQPRAARRTRSGKRGKASQAKAAMARVNPPPSRYVQR